MKIYCCGCGKETEARLTDGKEIYPHRKDLYSLPFWKCDQCENYVGCHHKTKNRTKPLGNIPTPELRTARRHIHKILDPMWKNGKMKRKDIYSKISDFLGYQFHTSEIRDIETARNIYSLLINDMG